MRITRDTRIYLTGCGGMLGAAFHARFAPIAQVNATDIDVNESWLSYADVRDYEGISKSIKDFNPDLIINLAALTDMEYCEKEPQEAWLTNALGAENVGFVARELDATYVYISTAGIFDGKQDYYSDFDTPNPLSLYAKSKYYGELFATQHVHKHYVVRAGWMMGGGPTKDKKFINKLYKQIVGGSSVLHVVNDKSGTPTYTVDFAAGVQGLVQSDMYGVYNQVCEGSATRYDVAVEFVNLLGLGREVQVKDVSSDFFKKEYFAPRPASEMLLNMKLRARGLNVMRDWRKCLREYSGTFVEHLQKERNKSFSWAGDSAAK